MSRANPTLADALKVPGFRVRLEPSFIDRMAALELLVAEHGKAEGIKLWADAEVRAIHLAYAQTKVIPPKVGLQVGVGTLRHGGLYTERAGDHLENYYIVRPGDRAKLATNRRKLARWWLAQRVSIDQARTLVGDGPAVGPAQSGIKVP